MSEPVTSFGVLSPSDRPRVLLLGSLPSVQSKASDFYYAHPKNAFWPILFSVAELPVSDAVEDKLDLLARLNIALWDVVAEAVRPGSLDSAIKPDSIRFNPIDQWLQSTPSVKAIGCNGGTANRLLLKAYGDQLAKYDVVKLPSTSPAYASMKFEAKQQAWLQFIHQSC